MFWRPRLTCRHVDPSKLLRLLLFDFSRFIRFIAVSFTGTVTRPYVISRFLDALFFRSFLIWFYPVFRAVFRSFLVFSKFSIFLVFSGTLIERKSLLSLSPLPGKTPPLRAFARGLSSPRTSCFSSRIFFWHWVPAMWPHRPAPRSTLLRPFYGSAISTLPTLNSWWLPRRRDGPFFGILKIRWLFLLLSNSLYN